MVTNRRRPAATRARRPIATAARRSGSGQDRPDGQNDHDDPDRDAGATTTDGTQRDEYDNDSPEQAGRSSPSTMFGPPFWAIRRTCAEKPAAPAATFAKWAPISQISPLITQVFTLVSEAGQPYRPTHPPVPIIAQTVKRHVWPHSWGNQGCHTPFVFLR